MKQWAKLLIIFWCALWLATAMANHQQIAFLQDRNIFLSDSAGGKVRQIGADSRKKDLLR